MSSISFPNGGHSGLPSSSSEHDDHFYPPAFESASVSGFQMNPMSSHPPRTPRVSIISGTGTYGGSIYTPKEEAPRDEPPEDDAEVDREDEAVKKRAQRIRKEEIWKEMLKTSQGRDKAFKIMQYSLKVYLLFHTTLAAASVIRRPKDSSWDHELLRRVESTTAGLSLSRKCLILFDWLSPLNSILARHTSSHSSSDSFFDTPRKQKSAPKPLLYTFLHTPPPVLLELIQSVSDDVSTFSKLGLLGAKTGRRAGRFADWCWFASTLVNLVENGVERSVMLTLQHEVESRLYTESMSGAGATGNSIPARKIDETELQRLQAKDRWLQITRAKLVMDLIFVSYDVFKIQRAKRSMQTFAGLVSAILSFAKLQDAHKTNLLKSKRY